MRPRRARDAFVLGAVLGAVACVAYLVGGFFGLIPGVVLVAYPLTGAGTALPGGAGAATGYGAAWLVLVGQAAISCAGDAGCGMPDGDRWLLLGAAILLAGLTLGFLTPWRERRS